MGCSPAKEQKQIQPIMITSPRGQEEIEAQLFKKTRRSSNISPSRTSNTYQSMLLKCIKSNRDVTSQLLVDSNIDSDDQNLRTDNFDLARIPTVSFSKLQARTSVSLKLEKTEIPQIDDIIDQAAFPMFALQSAYNQICRVVKIFNQVTETVGQEVFFSVLAMLIIFSVKLEGQISGLTLTISEKFPYLKFNQSFIRDVVGEPIIKTWNKLLQVVRNMDTLLPNIANQFRYLESKQPEIMELASKAIGNARKIVQKNLELLKHGISIHSELRGSLQTILKNFEGVKQIVSYPGFLNWLQKMGEESKAAEIRSNADIALHYWEEIRSLKIRILPTK